METGKQVLDPHTTPRGPSPKRRPGSPRRGFSPARYGRRLYPSLIISDIPGQKGWSPVIARTFSSRVILESSSRARSSISSEDAPRPLTGLLSALRSVTLPTFLLANVSKLTPRGEPPVRVVSPSSLPRTYLSGLRLLHLLDRALKLDQRGFGLFLVMH